MVKNLVFLADGTGNDGDVEGGTNIYKLFRRLRNDIPLHRRIPPDKVAAHLRSGNVRQVTQYDAGVGARPTDFIGKATGRGISRNIKDGYEFLIRFYEPGDRLYFFGFSRGAYTVRSLAGLIGYCGIPRREAGDGDLLHDEALRLERINAAYDIYRSHWGPEGYEERRQAGDRFVFEHGYDVHEDPATRAVYFIGVWDTVRSLGYAGGWRDWEIPGFRHRFHDHELSRRVRYAFQAISIDDPRLQFFPTIWNEPTRAQLEAEKSGKKNRQTFEQVWFPGVHSDVGGGYKESGLSDITLSWMIEKALACKNKVLLRTVYRKNPFLGLNPNPAGTVHDPRNTLLKKVLYRSASRYVRRGKQEPGKRWIEPIEKPPNIGKSWLERFVGAFGSRNAYDPPNLLEHPDVVLAHEQAELPGRPLPGPFSYFV